MRQDSTILYLHGFSSSPQSIKAKQFNRYFSRRGVELIIPDLEEGDFRNLTISGQMNVIRRIMHQNPSSKFGVVGSSMGGYLALLTAQFQPLVSALYLMCPGINFVKRWEKKLHAEYPGCGKIPGLIQVFNYRYNKVMSLNRNLFDDAVRWEQVRLDRQLPVRVVHGKHDDVVPIEESKRYLKYNNRAQLVELESDHGLLSHSNWIVKDAFNFFQLQGVLSS